MSEQGTLEQTKAGSYWLRYERRYPQAPEKVWRAADRARPTRTLVSRGDRMSIEQQLDAPRSSLEQFPSLITPRGDASAARLDTVSTRG